MLADMYIILNIYFFIQKMKTESSGCDKRLSSPRQDQEFVPSNREFETSHFLREKIFKLNPIVAFSNFWA